ncbi:MAG: macro domain-containing protein [Puniceicoccales bacterium]|nr:macro domain-containing protein [Puniceicoccales bacterium]
MGSLAIADAQNTAAQDVASYRTACIVTGILLAVIVVTEFLLALFTFGVGLIPQSGIVFGLLAGGGVGILASGSALASSYHLLRKEEGKALAAGSGDPVPPLPTPSDGTGPPKSPQNSTEGSSAPPPAKKLAQTPMDTAAPNANGTSEEKAAYRYRQLAKKFMEETFDGAPNGQKCTLKFPCGDGSKQEVKLFFSIDKNSVRQPTEALVNAANSQMTGPGGGINGAIWNLYGGEDGWQKTVNFPSGKTLTEGEVLVHPGPTLLDDSGVRSNEPAYVMQALGPHGPHDGAKAKLLGNCYEGSVREMFRLEISSLTFCNVSTAIFGYPKDSAAEIAVKTTVEALKNEIGKRATASAEPIHIWFAQFDDQSVNFYRKEFVKIQPTP